ncbi:blue copper domain-containing protein [Marine Group I thaumarchaeote SCGC AAA799-P11]|uniref:Blue copper domain-containing protein n=1 Tax=Marine Group I thaumarchaeote SCGC AAA799-P11 TaxID=1502295 RepID=A0A087S3F7_9ARCH|nr:blue copper domain-containing protein [Marine Group I thaumarchaeote SCGC AAA799-P11]
MKKIVLFLVLSITLGISPNAFGYGLGDAESSIIEINGEKLKIKTVITPEVIEEENSQFELKIQLLNSVSEEPVSNVGYHLKILDSDDMVLFEEYVFALDEFLFLTFNPNENSDFQFLGDKNSQEFWTSSSNSPLSVSGPVFLDGGIYKIQTSVKMLNEQDVKISNNFETILIIGEIVPFQITDEGKNYDLEFITYFDKIEDIIFDKQLNSVKANMKFNWDENSIDPIPFVHSEIYLPYVWEKFINHEINTFVNGIQVFGLVDKSQEEQIIVHFLINNKQLKTLSSQIDEEDHDKFIFEIRTGEPIEPISGTSKNTGKDDAMVNLSSESDWKVYFWWEPTGELLPEDETTFNIMFHDPDTNLMQKNITYDFFIYQNNEMVNSQVDSQTPSGHDLKEFLFESEGDVQVVIKNINGVDTSAEFAFYVGDESQKISIPKWVKNNAQWWSENNIDDDTFASGIEFMIKEKIIFVPETQQQKNENAVIPDWVRNNAAWWANDQISDKDFASGLQFLIESGIISV